MDTKDMIIETAFSCFLKEGFDKVSLNSLIKQTGLSKGGFYHYFTSKDELLTEIINRYFYSYIKNQVEKLESEIREGHIDYNINLLIRTIGDIKHKSFEVMGEEVDIREFFTLLFAAMNRECKLQEVYAKQRENIVEIIDKILQDGKRSGDIKSDIDTKKVAIVIYTSSRGTMFEYVISRYEGAEEVLEQNIKCILAML